MKIFKLLVGLLLFFLTAKSCYYTFFVTNDYTFLYDAQEVSLMQQVLTVLYLVWSIVLFFSSFQIEDGKPIPGNYFWKTFALVMAAVWVFPLMLTVFSTLDTNTDEASSTLIVFVLPVLVIFCYDLYYLFKELLGKGAPKKAEEVVSTEYKDEHDNE